MPNVNPGEKLKPNTAPQFSYELVKAGYKNGNRNYYLSNRPELILSPKTKISKCPSPKPKARGSS